MSTAGLLDGAANRHRLAVKIQTLRVWASRRKGPPRTVIARRPLYRREALEAWVLAAERDFEAERQCIRAKKRLP